jgi:Tfp pilus assembly protein PilO
MTGNRIWMLGVALVAVVVVALGWVFGISPLLAKADLASSQAQSADAQNAAQRLALVRLKSQFQKLPELSAQLTELQRSVPQTANLDDFLDQLQQLAQSTGVSITGFTAAEATLYGGAEGATAAPKPATSTPAPTDSAAPSSGTTTPASSLTDRLFSVPITIVVKGSSDQVMAFTDACQKGTRFFLVTTDSFTGSSDHPEDDGGTLTGFVFVVRDAPATAAAPAAPSAEAAAK